MIIYLFTGCSTGACPNHNIPMNTLAFNFQHLDVSDNEEGIAVEWNFDEEDICSMSFLLQGFNLSSLRDGLDVAVPIYSEMLLDSTSSYISLDHLGSDNDPTVYRMVAVNDDNKICSLSNDKFYRLNGKIKSSCNLYPLVMRNSYTKLQ